MLYVKLHISIKKEMNELYEVLCIILESLSSVLLAIVDTLL